MVCTLPYCLSISRELEWQKQRQKAKEPEDEEVEREMQERMRRASLRPIEIHPDGWEHGSKRQNRYRNYTYQQNSTVAHYESTEYKIEKVRDLLLSKPITGKLYIGGDTQYWRKVILKWINENQSGDTLVVSLRKIIGYLKNSGVPFTQK